MGRILVEYCHLRLSREAGIDLAPVAALMGRASVKLIAIYTSRAKWT